MVQRFSTHTPLEEDANIWSVRDAATGKVLTYLGLCVDDILIAGPEAQARQVAAALQTVRTTSTPEWLCQERDSFAFNGFELTKTPTGYKVHHEGYCKELLAKWEAVEGECRVPVPKEFAAPETPAKERG